VNFVHDKMMNAHGVRDEMIKLAPAPPRSTTWLSGVNVEMIK